MERTIFKSKSKRDAIADLNVILLDEQVVVENDNKDLNFKFESEPVSRETLELRFEV